jgi:hypothetical protein
MFQPHFHRVGAAFCMPGTMEAARFCSFRFQALTGHVDSLHFFCKAG